MKVILKTVKQASVSMDQKMIASIQKGMLLLVGFCDGDNQDTVDLMVDKILKLRVFCDENRQINLSISDVGGDILSKEICKKISKKVKNIHIYNEYGPTEATVGCMIHEYNSKDDIFASVPIGIPAKNVNLYVLNDDLNLIPFEQRGELYISGKCLSKGYVKLKTINKKQLIIFLVIMIIATKAVYITRIRVDFPAKNAVQLALPVNG